MDVAKLSHLIEYGHLKSLFFLPLHVMKVARERQNSTTPACKGCADTHICGRKFRGFMGFRFRRIRRV